RYVEALAHLEPARDRYQALGHRHTYAHAMNGIGRLYAQLGDYARSLSVCQDAVAVMEDLDDQFGLGSVLDNAGFAHHHLGRHAQAMACYERALRIFQEMGDRDSEASTSEHLGDTHLATGDLVGARRAWQRALALLDAVEQGAADA